jgi:hypothetical protein
LRNSGVAEQLAVSQEGLGSFELVVIVISMVYIYVL